ncbi:GIY-YIG nuclease family protein [Polaribacter sp. MSW13]|uniref:GIY-YIG nuclease family protein n=1 Tax=Polaribacter marinus TaxID=2916838 RepID=A0A9X1VQ91_9FLAO|nr:GIY-YIG nuclease family protein [Polaribacter marinus]MCI2230238.1 GIY-YIG nuclease family protein [Polaribacter marinus]
MGKTIITHLLEGTPKGIQSLQISNKNIMGFVIPRAELKKAKQLEELVGSPCLYILIEESEAVKPKAYLGQTDDFLERVYEHNQKKNFWDKAIVFISQASTLNKADILYLEYLGINHAREIGNYNIDENKQNPKHPKLQRHTIDTLNDFFEDVRFITEFAGYTIFKSSSNRNDKYEMFYTKGRKSDAQGFYSENGFTVLKGSIIASTVVNSFAWEDKRKKFIQEYTETIQDSIMLKTDYTFKSPSTAADFCIGSSNNGWIVWKNTEGKTLDEVFRKNT